MWMNVLRGHTTVTLMLIVLTHKEASLARAETSSLGTAQSVQVGNIILYNHVKLVLLIAIACTYTILVVWWIFVTVLYLAGTKLTILVPFGKMDVQIVNKYLI